MSNKIKAEFNPVIKEILTSSNILLNDGLTYLLAIHFGTNPSYIPEELKRKVLATNILTKDYSNGEVKWKVPLFDGQDIGFEWIVDFMNLFSEVNPTRRGTKSLVLTRMKKFFVNNPSIRSQDVMEATKLYIKNVNDPKYIKMSHKFIYEQGGSMLEDWIENYEKSKNSGGNKRKMM